MNILLANDHAGTTLKNEIKKVLESKGYNVNNLGCDSKKVWIIQILHTF